MLSSDALELRACATVCWCSRAAASCGSSRDHVDRGRDRGAAVTADTGARARGSGPTSRPPPAVFRGDYAPSLVLATLIVLLGTFVTVQNDHFLSPFNIETMLLLASALIS